MTKNFVLSSNTYFLEAVVKVQIFSRSLISLILLSNFLAACKVAAITPTPPPAAPQPVEPFALDSLIETTDIPYTSTRKLDVYAPSENGPWPLVVLYHGGGLHKETVAGISRTIASWGAVVFTPSWRSTTQTDPKKDLYWGAEDAACAIRFARAKAFDYGGTPARIVAVGHSAGGWAAALMALAGDEFNGDCLVKEGSAYVDAMVGLDGAYDLPNYVPSSTYEKISPKKWATIRPSSYIDPKQLRAGIEFHLFTGKEQELIDDAQSLYAALQAAGYAGTYANLPGIEHMDMVSARHTETIQRIVETMHR